MEGDCGENPGAEEANWRFPGADRDARPSSRAPKVMWRTEPRRSIASGSVPSAPHDVGPPDDPKPGGYFPTVDLERETTVRSRDARAAGRRAFEKA